jgi:replicative DNA helicase
MFAELTAATERGDRFTGIPTGFDKLDQMTAGLHPGELVIVAGRPGMGKTAFVLGMAVNVAAPREVAMPAAEAGGAGRKVQAEGFGVALFSLEMPASQIGARLACAEGRVDVGKLRACTLQPADWTRLAEA